MIVLGFVLGCCAGPQSALFSELFPAHIRYSGASLGYQVGAILGGGLAPIVATALYASFHTSTAITVYFVAIALVSLASILVLRTALDHRREPDMSNYYQPRKYPASQFGSSTSSARSS